MGISIEILLHNFETNNNHINQNDIFNIFTDMQRL